MNSLAIYRKYRPSNFDEVSGQHVVVNILKNAINKNNTSHAYLFTGPRGTGKTSIAKIFARTINCEKTVKNNPCNECSSCLNSKSKECVDIIEIDAASNNGVDEIRELKSKINIVPSYLKYKVYIIDEVHMLSIGAFNALLKTLEEPPAHVIFILATTELHKVPTTILSRCQVLEFKKISPIDMKNRLFEICKNENILLSDDAANEIISFSDGCMRDALSLLEKMNAYCNGNITIEDARAVCGKPQRERIIDFVESLNKNELEQCIKKIDNFYQSDYDMLSVVEDIIGEVEQQIFKGKNINCEFGNILSDMIKIYDNMKKSSVNKKIIFEVGILDIFCNKSSENISREIIIEQKVEQRNACFVENSMDDNCDKKVNTDKMHFIDKINIDMSEFKSIRLNNSFANANKETLQTAKSKWEELKKFAFDKENGAKVCLLLDGAPVVASSDYLVLSYQYSSVADKINEDYLGFEKILKKMVSYKCYIVALDNEEWKTARGEYIKKLNSGDKYQLQIDNYINVDKVKDDIIYNDELNNPKGDSFENKIYELFDSGCVEIK